MSGPPLEKGVERGVILEPWLRPAPDQCPELASKVERCALRPGHDGEHTSLWMLDQLQILAFWEWALGGRDS